MAFVKEGNTRFRVRRRIGGAPKAHSDLPVSGLNVDDLQTRSDECETIPDDPLVVALVEARDRGYRDGFERGKADGLRAGKEEGVREGRQAAEREVLSTLDPQLARVRSLCGVLTQPFATLRRTLAEAMVDGAQRLAARMVAETAGADAGALIRTVSDILSEVSAMEGGRNRLELRVHPEALSAVRELVDEAVGKQLANTVRVPDVTVVEDPRLEPGDMQAVLVPSSGDAVHGIEWDARLEERWNSIRTQLGLTTR